MVCMATINKHMRKRSTSSLRGSVEMALTRAEELINTAKNHDLSDEIVEKVKIGIFEPLQRAHKKLEKIASSRKAEKTETIQDS